MAEVITGYFDVNIDFRDAKSVLQNSGTALMSNGIASGENKAEDAVKKALDSPLLNDNKITGAKNVLLSIRSGTKKLPWTKSVSLWTISRRKQAIQQISFSGLVPMKN